MTEEARNKPENLALLIALSQLEDEEDGIEAVQERKAVRPFRELIGGLKEHLDGADNVSD